eukprot:TRINITY_DN2225_c0_g3_i2.p2 TRINITY_DN2225_c0_g3~~TRINITY_DN2225_c0_g3_i2.p2  ORF type:complete len:203 (-),score=-13.90 TRINITY_DN2225_c0_g3_i2:442-1050(-)
MIHLLLNQLNPSIKLTGWLTQHNSQFFINIHEGNAKECRVIEQIYINCVFTRQQYTPNHQIIYLSLISKQIIQKSTNLDILQYRFTVILSKITLFYKQLVMVGAVYILNLAFCTKNYVHSQQNITMQQLQLAKLLMIVNGQQLVQQSQQLIQQSQNKKQIASRHLQKQEALNIVNVIFIHHQTWQLQDLLCINKNSQIVQAQ